MDYTSLGCCALAFILYLNTLDAGFVYDDRRAIMGNTDVSSTTPWTQAFQNDYWGTPLADSGSHGSYRPLCVLSFKVNYIFGGYTPWGYHLINNLMHCLATGLVVKLARHLLSSVWGILATGALFAAHPIHTEAVAGIVGRADLAACIFYLLTYLTFIKHIAWRERNDSRQWLGLSLSIVLSFCAVLFKETAVTALVVCAIFDIVRGLCGFSDKNRYRTLGIIGAALITIVYIRLSVPGPREAFSLADNPVAKSNSLWTRFLTFLYLPVFNFKLLIYPSVLSFDWGMDAIPRITSIYDSRNFLTLVFYGGISWTLWRCVKVLLWHREEFPRAAQQRKSRTKRKQIIAGVTQDHVMLPASYSVAAAYNVISGLGGTSSSASTVVITAPVLPAKNDCVCRICKQEVTIRHTSTCRAINNNNVPGPYTDCGCHLEKWRWSRSNSPELVRHPNHAKFATFTARGEIAISKLDRYMNEVHLGENERIPVANSCNYSVNIGDKGCSNLLSNLPARTTNSVVLIMSIAFLTLPFLPATNLFFYVGFVVAERLLYLPSVGYCLLVGFGIAKIMEPLRCSRKRLAAVLCMSLILSMLSVKTWRRNYDWRDEESLFRSAINVNPPKALGNLGSVLSSQGRYNEAKVALLEALKYRPNMADVHFNLGILHQNQLNFKNAVENFQRAIQYRPNLALAYLNLGTSLIALGHCQEAASILKEGTKVDGTGVRDRGAHENARISLYLQLGSLYAEQGKLQRALAVYREALHSLPANYQREVLLHRIGDIFGKLQQWNEAEKYHRAALDIQPDHIPAHLSYGITLAKNSSRASEAELWFKRALKLAPADSSVHHHYAEFLTTLGRHDEACTYRVRAAELSPKDYSLVVSAATALRLLDRKIDAEKWYRKAVQLRPDDARAHTNLGAILHLLGRTQKAASSYKQALRLQPGDPTTLANLAKLGIGEMK
ncbi:unnamed protein product [Hermetia illucens]|uniref:dolichyl-phosphate-mannose--protein mannosyltransferase n=2 Tax=Hermetia illucens TaxID=343691 RepID=A0A7R8YRV8_HERIL|nr:unnamed protein product [Hermetia illucens]